ncbi:MAG TPA: hypothetical protein PL185_04375 [Flavobacteriales bacterium]|nr:hypothetical protein [Flavobacteriales bacterium]HPH81779.1 hypothetical protein [Flavobacteriales bacterium]
MRNSLTLFLLMCLIVTTQTACKRDDNSSNDQSVPSQVLNNVQQGNWIITLFNDSGSDELYHFTGKTFAFSNGTVTTTHNGATISGTYSSGTDDSMNKFLLNFGSVSPFDELNDDWHIIEQTKTKLRLQDVSGGNGGTDLLIFEKAN